MDPLTFASPSREGQVDNRPPGRTTLLVILECGRDLAQPDAPADRRPYRAARDERAQRGVHLRSGLRRDGLMPNRRSSIGTGP